MNDDLENRSSIKMYLFTNCFLHKKVTFMILLLLTIVTIFILYLQRDEIIKRASALYNRTETDIKQSVPTRGSIGCYRIKDHSLSDISDVKPREGRSIFFHETSCNSYLEGKIVISSRQACAVESAALRNPKLDVYLLFTSPMPKFNATTNPFIKVLLSYKNIKIHRLDYERYVTKTPLEYLYRSGKLESSKYSLSHASDLLRYLSLWKYGGTYMDLDIIVLKSIEKLDSNYAGSESSENVAAGIINLSPTGDGHHMADMCLRDLKYNFNGDIWGYNGPGVITRRLKYVCNVTTAKEMIHQECSGFRVYEPEVFYPIPWPKWKTYFDPSYNDKIIKMTKNSYMVHVWNNFSKNVKINLTSDVPYTILARKHCPKVFKACKDTF